MLTLWVQPVTFLTNVQKDTFVLQEQQTDMLILALLEHIEIYFKELSSQTVLSAHQVITVPKMLKRKSYVQKDITVTPYKLLI